MTSPGLTTGSWPQSAYVHVPFCVSKCHYCDFNSCSGLDSLHDPYVSGVVKEINSVTPYQGLPLETVYIGGGTPTVLSIPHLKQLLSALQKRFGLAKGVEVTVEANPATVDEAGLHKLLRAGFNRLSLGVQSFDDGFLNLIGRAHTASQAIDTFRAARIAGFVNISLDLMFALPGQTVRHWDRTLQAAISIAPKHISTYELTIEEGTRFARMFYEGSLALPSEDEQIEMYELSIDKLEGAGYEHYEVSNFALPGFRCRHNLVYWRNGPYFGFGAGATSFLDGVRAKRICAPARYIDAVEAGKDVVDSCERLTGRAALAETLIQGLRLLEGVELEDIRVRTGADVATEFSSEIAGLVDKGLLTVDAGGLRVTHHGLLLMNDVAAAFLP